MKSLKVLLMSILIMLISTVCFATTTEAPIFEDSAGVVFHELEQTATGNPVWIKVVGSDTDAAILEPFYITNKPCDVIAGLNFYYGYYRYEPKPNELVYHECKRRVRDVSWNIPKIAHGERIHGMCPLCKDDDIQIRVTATEDSDIWDISVKYHCTTCGHTETYSNMLNN